MLRPQQKRAAKIRASKSASRCVIFNPRAGSVAGAVDIEAQLQKLEPAVVYVTRKAGDARRFARQAIRRNCRCIITAGGDGTLNEVVNGVAGHAERICVGVLPLGTGNDFARSLNLPSSIEANIDILLRRKTRPVDLVRVCSSRRSRYFINVSAGGFSEVVDKKLTREVKKTWGPLAYLRSAAAALPNLHGYRAEIAFDRSRMRLDVYNIVVANGRYVAGGLPIAPDADVSDGLLDVVLIPTHPAAKVALVAAEILLGKHLTDSAVVFRRAKKITVRSRPRMWFNVDGELVGTVPAVFEVVPHALNFIVAK